MNEQVKNLIPKCEFKLLGGKMVYVIRFSFDSFNCKSTHPIKGFKGDNYRFEGTAYIEIEEEISVLSSEKYYKYSGTFKENDSEIQITNPIIISPYYS
nr:hypothetical protein [uncultured Bacteroides sp.]